jgi:DNA/RNA-binding domain of Phe-tRNA-synthetase-like protein
MNPEPRTEAGEELPMEREFTIADGIAEAFPDVRIHLIAVSRLRNDEPWPKAAAALDELEADAAGGAWTACAADDPRIASWHAAYRSFGTNPKRTRPSVEALQRRLDRQGRLPRISPAVDAYNLVSVRFGVPAGAFDLGTLGERVDIRHAAEGDGFTPLGEPEARETPAAGEVVYAQGDEILTRHWNHRDAEATKVSEATTSAVFLLEAIVEDAHPAAAAAAESLEQLLSEGGTVADHRVIDAGARSARLSVEKTPGR